MEGIWDRCVASVSSCHIWVRLYPVRKSVEEEQLMSLHDLFVPSQNQRKVKLKEIVTHSTALPPHSLPSSPTSNVKAAL